MRIPSTLPGCRALALAALLAVPALGSAQNAPLAQALSQLRQQRSQFGLAEADLSNPAVTAQFTDAHNGLTHVYLRQRHAGIEVLGAVADAHISSGGRVTSLHSSFLPNVAAQARGTAPNLSAEQAVLAAARALQTPAPSGLRAEGTAAPAEGITFTDGGISQDRIKAKLVYLPTAAGLRLVYDVLLWPLTGNDAWSVRIDATTGAFVNKESYATHEPVTFGQLTERALHTKSWPTVLPGTAAKVNVPNSYNVWPSTIESPNHGARQVVVSPANPRFSPFGWHDENGAAGAEYTYTRGNNVHAYDDRSNRNTYIPGQTLSPDGGPNLEFNFPYDPTLRPVGNLPAAVVNLFYWNNLLHDVMAAKGFTEAAGNFQQLNYSGQGLGLDQVKAEAQDGSGTDNANFNAPPDGTRGKMQMYTWSAPPGTLVVTAPASVAGTYPAGLANFGRVVNSLGSAFRGNLVLANDGSANPSRGCNALLNPAQLAGNIAVFTRGKCTFASKVKAAQDAGALMAVIVDSLVTATPNGMTGAAPDSVGIRIPSVFITKTLGDQLKAILAGGGTVTVGATGGPGPDGDFDNGIIAHEYGHGISVRLTGGAANSNCLNNAEQMGEGWSDFFALWMTTKPGDSGITPRGIGTYASSQPVTGPGIRRKLYSTDFTVNNHTYAFVGNPYTQVHAIGEVWAAALWDLNWALINRYGYNPDLTATTGGNNLCLQLVIDGLKLQPCSPGFLDGRDAILLADRNTNGGANQALIWQVFARRGMGFNAVQGSSSSLTDNSAGFALPPTVTLAKDALNEQLLEVYPNPAQDQLTVRTQVSSTTPVEVTLLTVLGRTVQTTAVPVARMQQEGVRLATTELANGLYVVRLKTSEGTITKKVMVQH